MMGLLEQVGGGGVSIRYGQFENALLSAGHEVRVLSPDRANVDCIVLNDKLHGFPFFEWTFANVCRLAAAIRWADVVVMPEVSAATPASGVCGLSVFPHYSGVVASVPYCRANRPRWRSCLPSCTRCSAMAGEVAVAALGTTGQLRDLGSACGKPREGLGVLTAFVVAHG